MIEPTLRIDDAARRGWDVVVLGAGPAGALASLLLARDGADVLLVDRRSFPRSKVCGGCLNGHALAVLENAGLTSLLASIGGCRLHEFHIATSNQAVKLRLPVGLAVSRNALDSMLVQEAIRSGVAFLSSTTGRIGRVENNARLVHADCRGHRAAIQARIVISATGLAVDDHPENSFACHEKRASRVGVGMMTHHHPKEYTPGTIFMAVGAEGYVGLTCVEDGQLNVAAALCRSSIAKAGVAGTCESILRVAGLPLSEAMLQGDWRGTIGLTRARRQCAGERLFAIGDSVAYVEPFTGEGMYWALDSASRVVPFVRRGISDWSTDVARQWDRHWRTTLARRQRLCWALVRLIRHPRVVRGLVRTLRVFPGLGQRVIMSLNG